MIVLCLVLHSINVLWCASCTWGRGWGEYLVSIFSPFITTIDSPMLIMIPTSHLNVIHHYSLFFHFIHHRHFYDLSYRHYFFCFYHLIHHYSIFSIILFNIIISSLFNVSLIRHCSPIIVVCHCSGRYRVACHHYAYRGRWRGKCSHHLKIEIAYFRCTWEINFIRSLFSPSIHV